jgi:hypothetical protein
MILAQLVLSNAGYVAFQLRAVFATITTMRMAMEFANHV